MTRLQQIQAEKKELLEYRKILCNLNINTNEKQKVRKIGTRPNEWKFKYWRNNCQNR